MEGVMRRVEVVKGMGEFVGKRGDAVREGRMWRVTFDEPVEVPGVGMVRDDLWEGSGLKTVRGK
jgi:hypothetical protein